MNTKILVVDDDIAISELLKQYLEGQGFNVSFVTDVNAMDQYLLTHSADLIILDIMLPGEDGLSIARSLREDNGIVMV